MKKIIFIMLTILPFWGYCQRNIRGKVSDSKNEPLIGAVVRIVGTTKGTTTDVDGNYSIVVPNSSYNLAVSYSGFEPKTITIGASNLINVVLSGGKSGLSSSNRWSLALFGGHSITSAAITSPIGISTDYGGKYWGGIKFGADFISRPKIKVALDIGAAFRDYGFKENKSNIPYITGIANINLRRRLFWRISMLAFGGGEYGKLLETNYYYLNPADNSTKYNIFLHQNDIVTVTYGGGLSIWFNRLLLDVAFERNLQMDAYDKQYGKTVGGRFSNVSLRYYLF